MAAIKPLAEKFKKVEVSMRKTLQCFTSATAEIDKALDGKRTKDEIEQLDAMKADWIELHKRAQSILMRLYD